MLGTLVYMILDVSFNVLLWSSQKAIEGSSILGEQIMKTYVISLFIPFKGPC